MSETTNESKATFPETINPFPSDPIIIEQLEKVAESFFNSIVNKNDIDKPKEITTQAKAEEKPTSSKKVQICLPQSDKKIKVSSNKGTNGFIKSSFSSLTLLNVSFIDNAAFYIPL